MGTSAPDPGIALLLYGNGAELGNFRFFADDTASDLIRAKKFDKPAIIINQTLDRATFFSALRNIVPGKKIKELHVFSHSIGAGLYVGYHEATAGANRVAAISAFAGTTRKITYERVLAAETGGILTDHLIQDPLKSDRALFKAKFAANASVKLWGCNSGVASWTYTDFNSTTNNYVSDQGAQADYYYWRALNTKNMPKPSIAQALSDYFGVTVFGAGSGSHIEVRHGGRWITSTRYKATTGHFPGEPQSLRLHPDAGDYNRFVPSKEP